MKFLFNNMLFSEEDNLPQEQPQQYCPGIRCTTGERCIPTKRRCDKYVDCMNAEDEQGCDYSGSQYNADFYRSRNTDHSNFKYSRLKSSEEKNSVTKVIVTTPKIRPATGVQKLNISLVSEPNTTVNNKDGEIETSTIVNVKVKTPTGLNDTILNAIKQLFDNQLTEETFSCRR